MDNRSAGHKQRLAREARMSAFIGIFIGAAFVLSARYILLFGAALQWLSVASFVVGLLAACLITFCFYESKAAVIAGAISYFLVSGAGLISCLFWNRR